MNRIGKVFFVMMGLLGSTFALAQNLSQHNWYFGNSTNGIRFNRASNKPTLVNNKAIPFGTGGSAVATDPSTANLLFYTDGNIVYDATHVAMLNGSGLNANASANQPVAICAAPGQPNKYFIFTSSSNFTTGGAVSSSVVDMGLFGNAVFPSPALGNLENPKNVAVTGLSNRSEGMIIVPHSNGTDFWLITQQVSSQNFSATLINAASYTGTFNTIVSSGFGFPTTIANFSYFKQTKKLAVSPQDPSTDAMILNFNDTNGAITFDRYIFNSGKPTTGTQSIYDIEWDPKGQYLYLSRTGEPGLNADVLQYDYLNPGITLLSVLSTPVFRSYGLQIAPDTAIYYLYQAAAGGPFLVDTFTKTDTAAAGVKRKTIPLGNSNFNGTQFPEFLPKAKVNLTASFTFTGTCQNTPTTFYPTITPNADSIQWTFGDGSDTTAWSPIHTYAQAQTFNVSMIAYYQGDTASAKLPVTIKAFPLKLTLVQDTTACKSEFPPPRGSSSPIQFSVKVKATGGTPTSYTWSNGNTGPILKPDSAGYYYVVVSDASGCSTYAGVNVKEYGLQDQRQNIWYFGNKAGIDFNVSPPKALNNSAMDAPEGCAIVCDRNGQTIFYTDGDKVYDKTNTQIDVGIGGDPLSTQSSIIFPVPGDETLYYIFTTQAINGTSQNELRYSLFDLKQNSGKGAVTQKNVLMFSKSTERVTANGNWVVVHEYGNNTFRAYRVSSSGIADPVYTAIGSDHSFQRQQNGEGYMKLGPRNNLAVALSTPGTSNFVELFHLNDSTGTLTNYRKIDLKEPAGQVYGIEFSPGGNKVFATITGTPSPSTIFEYSLDSLEKPHFKQKLSVPAQLGAIQLAPNGQVYVAANDAAHNGFLGTIAANDDTTKVSAFQLNGFALAAGTNSRLGLPNFRQQITNAFGGPMFTYTGVCVGDSTHFAGTATDAIDKFQWSFGDGGSSTQASPVHLYGAPGLYTVSMHLTNRCSLDTILVQKVTIFAPPPPPTVPPATALCNGPVNLNANSGNLPGLTYLWTNGDTTKIVVITQPAFISVTDTDQNGCHSTAQAIVADNRPQVALGPDLTVCQNNNTPVLDAQNPGATFVWKINGVNASTIQTQAVDTSLPGIFVYSVIVTDPFTSCTVTSQKTFAVMVSPLFVLSGTNPTTCNAADGTIQLQLNTSVPPAGPYSYFLTGPNGFNQQGIDQAAPSTIGPIAGQKAGVFSGIVTDQVSGCTISSAFGLTDSPFTAVAAAQPPNCNPVTVRITSTATVFPLTYSATNNATGQVTNGNAPSAAFNMTPLGQGTYTIQISDASGCIFVINNFAVTPSTPPTVTLTPNICTSPPTIKASGSSNYTWTTNVAGSIVGSTSGPTIQVLPGAGLVTYTVTASPGGCPGTQSITVDLKPVITPTFVQSTPCAAQIVLTASPTGPFTYRWYKGGVLQPALVGQQIALGASENGASYSVETVDTQTGCTAISAQQPVQVAGLLTAILTASPACDDNKPFTLTSSTNSSGVTYAWFLNNNAIAGATAATLDQTSEGTYKVEISKASCTSTAQIQILKFPSPAGKLPDQLVICNDPENKDPNTAKVDLDPGPFARYNWFKNQLTLGDTTRVYTVDSEGLYQVDLTNSFGCVASDKTDVKNECIPKIVAPTAFRPSSSQGPNRDFYVFSFFITDDFKIFIYNRWGELVYQASDRDFKWNGNFNNGGQALPGGMYAYVIKYVSAFQPEKGVQEQHGGVVLVR